MQRQGINPFIELDPSDIPTSGDNYADVFGTRKIYGNIIDGLSVPGLRLHSDGTVRYASRGPDGASLSWDVVASYVSNMRGYELELFHASQADVGYTGGGTGGLHRESYSIESVTHTLAGGVLANAPIANATAGNKAGCAWISLSWDTDPAVAYTLQFQEEDSATVLWELRWTPSEIGERKWLYTDCATDNKDMQADISGGAGAEILYTRCNFCLF